MTDDNASRVPGGGRRGHESRPQITGRFYRAAPVKPLSFERPTWKFLDACGPSSPAYPWLVAATGLLGIFCLSRYPNDPDLSVRTSRALKQVRVQGQLTVEGSGNLEDLQVVLGFPEIPYLKQLSWKKDEGSGGGRSVTVPVDLHFRCLVRPSHYSISVHQAGFKTWKSPAQGLEEGRAQVTLPTIRLQPEN